MTTAYIIGAGVIPFGKHLDRSVEDMGAEAARLALRDAGIAASDVEAGFFANALAARLFGDTTIGQNVFWDVGINRIPVYNVENACTSGSSAFTLAWSAVSAGQAEVALVVGSEKVVVPQMGLVDSGRGELDSQMGMVAPAAFAMRAVRHMVEFGTTPEQLAAVAVKNRRHAALNPCAQFRGPLTVEEVLASPMIVDPLTRLQCCPNADGAAAVVLATSAFVAGRRRAVGVRSALLRTGSYEDRLDLSRWETDYRTCREAYERAGTGPQDVDMAECHDAFTISEILHYEALGLCAPGEGGRLAADGETALGGRVPVNTSGGLLSRGHPLGATGVAQLVEVVTQLRGEAGRREVEGARIGVAQCMGGDKAADTRSCTVVVLEAPARHVPPASGRDAAGDQGAA